MKFYLLVPCAKCGEKMPSETTGEDDYPDVTCPKCGTPTWVIGSSMRISHRMLARAEHEFQDKDYSITILLSAMSVEAELAYQYSKWKQLDANILPHELTPTQEAIWEEEFQKMFGVGTKVEGVFKLLTGQTFTAFLNGRPGLDSAARSTHPKVTTSVKQYFEDALFKKRNRIVHSGEVGFDQATAEEALKVAGSLLQIINEADKVKFKELDARLKP